LLASIIGAPTDEGDTALVSSAYCTTPPPLVPLIIGVIYRAPEGETAKKVTTVRSARTIVSHEMYPGKNPSLVLFIAPFYYN
jgi:hypothetical protein